MRIRINSSIRVSIGMIMCICGFAFPLCQGFGGQVGVGDILKSTDRDDGLCVLVNVSDPELAIAIAQKSKFVVHVIHEDAEAISTLRKAIDRSGLYGRVSVDAFGGETLPYAENLVNCVVIQDPGCKIQNEEVMRVLAPFGVAYTNGKKTVKPYPEEMDEWTHYRHNAEGNMVSQDTIVAPPRHVRWVANPMFQRHHALTPGTTAMVATRDRIFYIQDESPVGFAGLPDKWRLVARDAFNGKLLWKRDMGAWGDTVWSWWSGGHGARQNHPVHVTKRLVADKNRVFVTLGYNTAVSSIDAITGKTLIEYEGTQYADEIVCHNGMLYVSVNDRPQKPLPGKGFSSNPTSQNESKKTIMAVEPESGKVLWEAGPYVGVGAGKQRMASMKQVVMIASEKGIFIHDNKNLLGLDLKTGKEIFSVPSEVEDKAAAIYHKGLVIVAGKSSVTGFDAETGEQKWQVKYNPVVGGLDIPEIFAIGDLVWLGEGRKMYVKAVDYTTGEEVKRISIEKVLVEAGHHHRCYPNRSTVNYLITGRRAAEFTDYRTGEVSVNHWARGQCRLGHIPANGLLYKPPDPCTCHLAAKLLGFYALAGEETIRDVGSMMQDKERLRKGQAFADNITTQQPNNLATASDWPQFRHDVLRSSSVRTEIPENMKTLWSIDIGRKITPPVIAGGRVYVSSVDEHKVYALDEKGGKKLWAYIAGGRVDSPPSIYGGNVIFGAADGSIYCLRASDGELAWRFRAAPYERNIMAYNQVESVWPVRGSVMVANGVAYASAGRSSFVDGGIYLYALDVATGEVLGRNVLQDVQTKNGGGAKKMPDHAPGAASDILVTDGTKIYSRSREFDFKVPFNAGKDDYLFPVSDYLNPGSSFFDEFWFHRLSWVYDRVKGNMIAFDEGSTYSAYMYKRSGSGQYKLYVPRGGDVSMIPDRRHVTEEETGIQHMGEVEEGGFVLQKISNKKTVWKTETFPIMPFSMVVAENKLLIAGCRDAVDTADPWANVEGRKGSVLWILSGKDGKKLTEYPLETLPIWNGMAAANGRIFISLKSGRLICLGE